jgi:nucleolar protein 9
MWELYFKGKIGKMASHPIGNFVTAAGIKRLDDAGIENVVTELQAVGTSNLTSERSCVAKLFAGSELCYSF